MKNLFCLLASLLSLPVFAQKVDLDAEPVTVHYFFTNNLKVSGYQKGRPLQPRSDLKRL